MNTGGAYGEPKDPTTADEGMALNLVFKIRLQSFTPRDQDFNINVNVKLPRSRNVQLSEEWRRNTSSRAQTPTIAGCDGKNASSRPRAEESMAFIIGKHVIAALDTDGRQLSGRADT